MRTDWCGELTPGRRGPGGRAVRLGGHAVASTASTWPSSTCGTAPGSIQCVVAGADDLRSEYVVQGVRHRAPPARGHDERRPGHRRGRGRATARSRCWPPPSRRRSRSATASTSTRSLRLRHRYLDLRRDAPAAQPRRPGQGQPGPAQRHGRAGLHRDRDADAHRLDPRGGPGLRGALPPAPRRASTPCPRAPSSSSSSAWSAGWTATSRSPAACGTRTCGPTASSSSCSSTLEASFVGQDDVLAFISSRGVGRGRGRHRRAAA